MKVRFLQDFQSSYTGPRFYLRGEEADFELAVSLTLIQERHAVAAEVEPKQEAPKSKRVARRKQATPKKGAKK